MALLNEVDYNIDKITGTDIYRIVKDHQLDTILSVDYFKQILHYLSLKFNNNNVNLNKFNYFQFLEIIKNISNFISQHHFYQTGHQPQGEKIRNFINILYKVKKQNQNKILSIPLDIYDKVQQY